MHVPLIGCLNTHQLLLRGCIWPFKIYARTFLEISSCRRARTLGECPPGGPQRHSFCGPSGIPGLHPHHNSEWVLSLKLDRAVILSLAQIDGHWLSGQVGTIDASHLGDTLVGTLGKHRGVLFLLGGTLAPWEVPTTEQVLPIFLIPASLGQRFSNHGP